MDLQISGARAIITGAGDGIGAATAKWLAAEGVRLILVGRREEPLQRIAAQVVERGGARPLVLPADVSDDRTPELVRSAVASEWGGMEILVNNAGGSDSLGQVDDDATWEASMAVNFHGKRRLAEALLPFLKESTWGRIINLVGSAEPRRASPAFTAVAATRMWSKGLSRDVGRDGISHPVGWTVPRCDATTPTKRGRSSPGERFPPGVSVSLRK